VHSFETTDHNFYFPHELISSPIQQGVMLSKQLTENSRQNRQNAMLLIDTINRITSTQ
jgi:hypothetical protein